MRRAALAAALAALPGAAPAGAVLTLTIDGSVHSFVPQMEGARTGFSRFATLEAVSIEGTDGPGRMVVELSLPSGARAGDAPYAVRISFRPDGWRDYWVSPPELPGAAVTVEALDLSGPAPRIAGSFEAPLCFTPTPLHPPDATRCRTASGRFATPLVPD